MPGLPQELYSSPQTRALDAAVVQALALAPGRLMERAGEAALAALRLQWPRARRIAIVCGPGNNGGDGFVLARRVREAGLTARVLLPQPIAPRGNAAIAWDALRANGGDIAGLDPAALADADIVVDAVFGTGLTRAPDGAWRAAIDTMNAARRPVFALDIPSGIDSDTGACLGAAVRADHTLSFIALKAGLFTGAGAEHAGRVALDDLDAPARVFASVPPVARRITPDSLRGVLPARPRGWHKGDAGHVVAIGGNVGMAGAARMTGEAAYRAGAGLVMLGTHPAHAACVAADRPELMSVALDDDAAVRALLARADVVALGPGLGRDGWAQRAWSIALDHPGPLVLDADALSLLAMQPRRRDDWILTPHPGEAARLLGVKTADVQADRPTAARAIAQRYGGVCVLKGVGTLVCGGAEPFWVCDRGDPAMATGGTGDVLTGLIAGLIAQRVSPVGAARAGAWVHACAGEDAARGGIGLLATDLLPHVRARLNTLIA